MALPAGPLATWEAEVPSKEPRIRTLSCEGRLRLRPEERVKACQRGAFPTEEPEKEGTRGSLPSSGGQPGA